MSDWETLFNGDTNKLSQSFSLAPANISELVRLDIKHHNKNYLNHIIHAAKTSPLAVLEIGVTPEIIKLLREVKIEQKNNALRFKLPLFQWRFTDLELSLDGGKEFSEVDWLHYLIQSTPVSLKNLSPKSDLSKTYHVEYAYPLVEHLVRFNMRATIIRTLLPNYHEAKIRDLYKRLLSMSSSCGKLPSSFTWYFSVERRRTHSSFFLLLYRLAQRSGLEHIHSIIAAYSWYLALAPEDPMSIDRLGILVATAQSGSGTVYVSACRSCTANYLLCNMDEKKEFAHSFHCEPCRKKRQLAA